MEKKPGKDNEPVKKQRNFSLRPMFGEESSALCDEYKNGMNEGDIIFINNRKKAGESVNHIYKKESIINRYLVEFEKTGINPLPTSSK